MSANSLNGPELFEKLIFSGFVDPWNFIQFAFLNAFFQEKFVVSIGGSVGFVPNSLEEFECVVGVGELNGNRIVWTVDFLEFLGEADDGESLDLKSVQFLAGAG